MDNQKIKPDVIIFDLFGTLVDFGIQRHPYRELMKYARNNGRKPLPGDARTIMTIDGDIRHVADQMGINAPETLILKLIEDIDFELESLAVFNDVIPVLQHLQKQNCRVAICSNLAKPYGSVIERFFSQYAVKKFLSYQRGFIKPETAMYSSITSAMNVKPECCLFVGDTYIADVLGPQQIGMNSIHLCRANSGQKNNIGSLSSLLKIF
ncbi:MAG: HAD family hydrolase [Pseudomonadota bacterium]